MRRKRGESFVPEDLFGKRAGKEEGGAERETRENKKAALNFSVQDASAALPL